MAADAGLPDSLSPLVLRKSMGCGPAEAGCTSHENTAASGHRPLAEVTSYTIEAGRTGIAQRAVDQPDRIETGTKTVKTRPRGLTILSAGD